MYLAMLSREEKELFLELALVLVRADGDYSEKERAMISGYCMEMQLNFKLEKNKKVRGGFN